MGSQTSARITERKTRLDGTVVDYLCEPLLIEPGRRAVVRYVSDTDRDIEGTEVRVAAGTVTIGHFWADRPYNVYHLIAGGRTLAYYCSVATDTRIAADLIAYTDLVVDALVRPSAATTVLDEDELPDDVAPSHRGTIARGLEAILTDPRTLIREIERESAAAQRANRPGQGNA